MEDWITLQIRDRDVAVGLAEYAVLRGWSFQVDPLASEAFEEKEWVFAFPAHLGKEPQRYKERLQADTDAARED